MSKTQLGAIFLAQLSFGSALLLPFFPVKITGKSFSRFYYGLITAFLAMFVIALYKLDQFQSTQLIVIALAGWMWLLTFNKAFTQNERVLMWAFAAISVSYLFIYPSKYVFHDMSLMSYVWPFMSFLVATVFLSFHIMNMIFGHWYLVNKDLPISHLVNTSRWLIYVTYLRAITVGIAVYQAYNSMSVSEFDHLIDFMGNGVFFWARICAGILLPLLVVHLSYESAKIKSNQSATGILYAGNIFVLMGEIMALYLYNVTGIIF